MGATKGSLLLSLALLAVLLSLGARPAVNTLFSLIFIALSIWLGNWSALRGQWLRHPVILGAILIFLSYALAALFSVDQQQGWMVAQTKLMLMLFPLSLAIAWPKLRQVNMAGLVVTASLILASAALVRAGVRYFGPGDFGGDLSVFFYFRLSSWMIHPNYLILLLGAAIIYLWHALLWKRPVCSLRTDSILLALLLIFVSFFLQARTGLLLLTLILVPATLWLKSFVLQKPVFWGMLLIPVVAVWASLNVLPEEAVPRYRVDTSLAYHPDEGKDTSLSGRLVIWQHCWSCVKERPVLGQGSGDYEKRLMQAYQDSGFYEGAEEVYNCHNQYLETMLAIGVPGVLLLLFILFAALRSFFYHPEAYVMLAAFVLFFFGAMAVESILERQKGVMIFALIATHLSLLGSERLQGEDPLPE